MSTATTSPARPRQGRLHRDPELSRQRQRPMAMIHNGWAALEALDRRRYLTSSQVARLLFLGQPSLRGASRGASAARKAANELCLARLKDRGFVAVCPVYRRHPGDARIWDRFELNILTAAGHAALLRHKDELGETYVSDWTPGLAVPDPDDLPHQLALRDVLIAAELGCRSLGIALLAWWDDDRLRAMRASGQLRVGDTIPDALIVVATPTRTQPYFIEVDRATEAHTVWANRIDRYDAYLRAEFATDPFFAGCARPLVLTVTTTPARLAHLVTTTEAAGGGRLFWFSCLPWLLPPEPTFAPSRSSDHAQRQRQLAARQPLIDAHTEATCRAFFSAIWRVATVAERWTLGDQLSA